MEPGTQRWWFGRFLSWAEAETATENPLGMDFGGRQRRDEKPGLGHKKAANELSLTGSLFHTNWKTSYEEDP